MAGYSHTWDCDRCGKRQETIDWPRHTLCDRCDDKTRLTCVVCGGRTNVTPRALYLARGNRRAVHGRCIYVDDTQVPVVTAVVRVDVTAWDSLPTRGWYPQVP